MRKPIWKKIHSDDLTTGQIVYSDCDEDLRLKFEGLDYEGEPYFTPLTPHPYLEKDGFVHFRKNYFYIKS